MKFKKKFLAEIYSVVPGLRPSSQMNITVLTASIDAISILDAMDIVKHKIVASGLLHTNLSIELEEA